MNPNRKDLSRKLFVKKALSKSGDFSAIVSLLTIYPEEIILNMENSLCRQVFTIVMRKNENKLDLKQAGGI